MQSHLLLLIIFALFVSIVFAVIARDDVRGQVMFGSKMFGGLVGAALVLGWLMYPLPL
jgi:hypothetical protein